MSIISAGTTTTTALVQTGDTNGNLVLQTGSTPTTAMTISSSQIVNFANAPTVAGTGLIVPSTVGTSGQVLTSNATSTPTWTTPTIVAIVQAETSTTTTSTSSSFVTANLSASITPKSASNKILVIVTASGYIASLGTSGIFTIFRGTVAGTNLGNSIWGFMNLYGGASPVAGSVAMSYLDSPATTSSQTYTVGMRAESSTVYINPNGQKSIITLMEIAE